MTHSSTRRTVLAAGTAALLVGCGNGDGDDDQDTGGKESPGTELGGTADIPVGGGKVFKAQKVVVTQPVEGEFKAFSAVCTHQGCTVGSVADGVIHCPCHQSKFRIADGSVAGGPAKKPLPAERVTVEGDSIRLA